MSENQKPFIPAWLDEAGLTQAEFRLYCHLCRRADNNTSIAWPSYQAMIETCGGGKTTIRRSLERLAELELIAKVGKPFGGSCRYKVFFAIVPPQGQLDANSSTTGTIETSPIVPPQDCNSPSGGTSIVPPQGQEGNPIRKSNKEIQHSEISLALPFQSEAFSEAWNDWTQHRREIKKKLTPTSIKNQFKKFSKWGEARTIAAITNSTENGYQGIFEASGQTAKPQPATPAGAVVINGRTFKS